MSMKDSYLHLNLNSNIEIHKLKTLIFILLHQHHLNSNIEIHKLSPVANLCSTNSAFKF